MKVSELHDMDDTAQEEQDPGDQLAPPLHQSEVDLIEGWFLR